MYDKVIRSIYIIKISISAALHNGRVCIVSQYRPHRVHIGPLLPSAAVVLSVTDAEECLSQLASTEDN